MTHGKDICSPWRHWPAQGRGGKHCTPGLQERSPEGTGHWGPLPAATCPFPYTFAPLHPDPGQELGQGAHPGTLCMAGAAWCHPALLKLQHWLGSQDGRPMSVCLSLPGVHPAGWLPTSPVPSLPGQFWLWAPSQRVHGSPQQHVRPCPRDRARMLSAFMVMFGFLVALPNRRRKKKSRAKGWACSTHSLPLAVHLPPPPRSWRLPRPLLFPWALCPWGLPAAAPERWRGCRV